MTQRHRTTHWLWVKNSERPITLPHIGNLVLGRFDPNVGIPPDIDLNYEDQRDYIISRRHARIIGQKGQHSIEDLGSKAGIYLNGEILQKGASPVLKADDEVFLGNIQLDYVKIPTDILKGIKSKQMRHTFTITPTGRKVVVDPQGETVIGRADPHLTFVPDIDLREEGHLADRVSRRHVIIRWRKGIPFLEDLGSSFGTRLLGEMLPLGRSVVLNPGDHIWLAGCVLAYNLELEKEME